MNWIITVDGVFPRKINSALHNSNRFTRNSNRAIQSAKYTSKTATSSRPIHLDGTGKLLSIT